MKDSGFTTAHALSMLDIHNHRLNTEEKLRIEKLEIFDEFEEWDMLQSHYLICIGSRSSQGLILNF